MMFAKKYMVTLGTFLRVFALTFMFTELKVYHFFGSSMDSNLQYGTDFILPCILLELQESTKKCNLYKR